MSHSTTEQLINVNKYFNSNDVHRFNKEIVIALTKASFEKCINALAKSTVFSDINQMQDQAMSLNNCIKTVMNDATIAINSTD